MMRVPSVSGAMVSAARLAAAATATSSSALMRFASSIRACASSRSACAALRRGGLGLGLGLGARILFGGERDRGVVVLLGVAGEAEEDVAVGSTDHLDGAVQRPVVVIPGRVARAILARGARGVQRDELAVLADGEDSGVLVVAIAGGGRGRRARRSHTRGRERSRGRCRDRAAGDPVAVCAISDRRVFR